MAAVSARSERKRVSHNVLHRLSTVDILYAENRKKARSKVKCVGFYEAERVVASRGDAEGAKYLVKWKGYSAFKSTWEPKEHLSPSLLGYYESPKPGKEIIEECVDRMRVSLLDALRHKGPQQRLTLEFRHDVYRYLFYGKGKDAKEKNWRLFDENDFSRCKLPPYWNCIYDKHGDGVKLRFPLKMRKFLQLSPMTYQRVAENIIEALRAYIEKITIKFV